MSRASPLQLELASNIAGMIRDEALSPGAKLGEEELARRFGVSRSPVRAALKLLAGTGHVALGERSGAAVARGARRLADFPMPREARTMDELYRKLLSDREKGVWSESVSEAQLLARYGIARAVLGKVLLRLTREGLVERRKGHGWRFLPTLETPEAIRDSYRFRMIVECAGLREPAFHLDPAVVEKVRAAHLGYLEMKPGEGAVSAYFEMNLRFHELLAQGSGNRYVLQAVQQMNRLRKIGEIVAFLDESYKLQESTHEHLGILDAILAGDREWAAAQMHRHLALALERSFR